MALTDSTDDNLPVLEPGLVYLDCGPYGAGGKSDANLSRQVCKRRSRNAASRGSESRGNHLFE